MSSWKGPKEHQGYWDITFHWHEPRFYPIRLRKDWFQRFLVLLGIWGVVSGLLLNIFTFNGNRSSVIWAVLLGGFFSGIFAYFFLFGMRSQIGAGRVQVGAKGIQRYRQYFGLGPWVEDSAWLSGSIRQCALFAPQQINRPFGLLTLVSDSEIEMIGIPQDVDSLKLGQYLYSLGVPITVGERLPDECVRPLPLPMGMICMFFGMMTFMGGMLFYGFRVSQDADTVAQQNEMPNRFANTMQSRGFEDGISATPQANNAQRSNSSLPENTVLAAGNTPPAEEGNAVAPPVGSSVATALHSESGDLPDSVNQKIRFLNKTELFGGTGGLLVDNIVPEGKFIIGLKYSLGSWAGEDAVGSLKPIVDDRKEFSFPGEETIRAPSGYAIGAFQVDANVYVNAVRVIYFRISPDGELLDPEDYQIGPWIGEPTGKPLQFVGGTGARVIGFQVRGAAVVDAFGLILE